MGYVCMYSTHLFAAASKENRGTILQLKHVLRVRNVVDATTASEQQKGQHSQRSSPAGEIPSESAKIQPESATIPPESGGRSRNTGVILTASYPSVQPAQTSTSSVVLTGIVTSIGEVSSPPLLWLLSPPSSTYRLPPHLPLTMCAGLGLTYALVRPCTG